MNDIVRADLQNILHNTIKKIEKDDTHALADISNHTIHNASIFQDKESVTIAVIIYALSKLGDRLKKIRPKLIPLLKKALQDLRKSNFKKYDLTIERIVKTISRIDKKMNLYIQHIINRAEIKKGSKIYDHGISLGQTADILGLSQWELMNYIGKTKLSDRFDEQVTVMERIRFAESLFR